METFEDSIPQPEDFDPTPSTIGMDPYQVLGVDAKATDTVIKRAYRKLALQFHPDKVPDRDKVNATKMFQKVALAYAVLSDPVRRNRYDIHGSTEDCIVDSDGFNWTEYYSEIFRDAISADAIEEFAKTYKGSDEERSDLLYAYRIQLGDMDRIYETTILSNVLEDDERFRAVIDEAIKDNKVPAHRAYVKETKKSKEARIKAAQNEANEAEEYAKELGVHDKLFGDKKGKKGKKGSSEDDLATLIQRNQKSRSGFLDQLEAKYGTPSGSKKGKKRAVEEEPSEEEFQAAAARLNKAKKNRTVEDEKPASGRMTRRRAKK